MIRPISVVLLTLALGFGCNSSQPAGTKAPAFAATDTAGRPASLAAFDDQVLILDFWAVW